MLTPGLLRHSSTGGRVLRARTRQTCCRRRLEKLRHLHAQRLRKRSSSSSRWLRTTSCACVPWHNSVPRLDNRQDESENPPPTLQDARKKTKARDPATSTARPRSGVRRRAAFQQPARPPIRCTAHDEQDDPGTNRAAPVETGTTVWCVITPITRVRRCIRTVFDQKPQLLRSSTLNRGSGTLMNHFPSSSCTGC